MSISIHLHDGELQKLVEYCVDAYIAGIRFAYERGVKSFTTGGSVEKSDRRYLQAEQKLVNFAKSLTPGQRERIDNCFKRVIDFQQRLQQEGLSKKEKKKIANSYRKVTKKYEKTIKVTSTEVTHDLTTRMGKAESYLMAAACDEHDFNALEMAKGIMAEFQESLPKAALKESRQKMASESAGSRELPAAMMKHVAHRVKAVNNS